MNECPTSEVIVHGTPGEEDSGLSINATQNNSVYDYPASPGIYEDPDQLMYIYPSVNAGYVTERDNKVDERILDENYTELRADRNIEYVSRYEPLRPTNSENNESVDQGYVHVIN